MVSTDPREERQPLNKCWICGHRGPWRITMDMDHLAAKCGYCGAEFDIGHSAKGFDPDAAR